MEGRWRTGRAPKVGTVHPATETGREQRANSILSKGRSKAERMDQSEDWHRSATVLEAAVALNRMEVQMS